MSVMARTLWTLSLFFFLIGLLYWITAREPAGSRSSCCVPARPSSPSSRTTGGAGPAIPRTTTSWSPRRRCGPSSSAPAACWPSTASSSGPGCSCPGSPSSCGAWWPSSAEAARTRKRPPTPRSVGTVDLAPEAAIQSSAWRQRASACSRAVRRARRRRGTSRGTSRRPAWRGARAARRPPARRRCGPRASMTKQ